MYSSLVLVSWRKRQRDGDRTDTVLYRRGQQEGEGGPDNHLEVVVKHREGGCWIIALVDVAKCERVNE